MSTERVRSEKYRGVNITIERADHHVSVDGALAISGFAAHVPLPGHGYIGRYFETADDATAAARALVDSRLAAAQSGGSRWTPPDERRVPMNLHPHAKDHLHDLLMRDLGSTGVGHSEFVWAAVEAFRDGKFEIPGIVRPRR